MAHGVLAVRRAVPGAPRRPARGGAGGAGSWRARPTAAAPPAPALETVAARLRHARDLRGLGRNRLSDAAGLSPAAVQWIEEHPGQSPKVDTIEKLAGALDVAPEWLAWGRGRAPRAAKAAKG